MSCDQCGYRTHRLCLLNLHMNSTHKVEECKCTICKKLCPNQEKLKLHIKKMHVEKRERKHKCLICGASYKNYADLKKHFAKHMSNHSSQNTTTYSCDICGVEFLSKPRIEQHIIFDHSKLFKCLDKKCFKSFNDLQTRRDHYLRFHSTDKKVR